MKALADIEVTLADGTVLVLHQVDVNGITAADARVDGETAYFEYVPTNESDKVSTLESEKAIAQQKADEEAAKAAEEAEEAGDSEEATYEEEVYYEDAYSGGDGGGSYVDDSAVGSGNEEACVPDIVLR